MADSKHDKYFTRMIMMMQRLSEKGSATLEDLAKEYDVSTRTIRRDVKKLHFFPIELEKGVLRVTDGFSLEKSNLQDIELLISELAFSAIDGMDEQADKHLKAIRAKISNPLFFTPYNIKPENFEAIDMDSELLNKIEDAIIKRNFSKLTSNDTVCVIEPYKVVAFDGFWYLLAKDTQDNKIKTFMIATIQEFRATTKIYDDEYIDIGKVLQNVHTAWFEDGNSFDVQVKVKKEIAHFFILKKHLSSQEILRENSDGSIIVSFSVSSDEDVDNLIKAWLPHIEVIKPERFRKKLITELEAYVQELKNSQYHK